MHRFNYQRGYLLRTRAIWLGCAAFAFLLAAQLWVRYYFTLPAMMQLVSVSDSKDQLRVNKALSQRLELYMSRVSDNALWNDAYEFVVQPNDAFISSNFDKRTLIDNELDGVIFLDGAGKVIWQYGVHFGQQFVDSVSAQLLEPPIPVSELLQSFYIQPQQAVAGEFETRKGYLRANEGALVFAASPVFPTDVESGAVSAGTLIMWAWLDRAYFDSLAEQTKLSLTVEFLDANDKTPAVASVSLINEGFVVRNSEHQLVWLQKDVHGEPLFLLRIQLDPLGQEYQLFSQSILGGVFAALFLLLALAWVVKGWLINPLVQMGQQMDVITESGTYQDRLNIVSYGQLERLSNQFNLLLEEVCAQQSLTKKKQAKLQKASISDALTGIANRRYLDQFMDETWKEAKLRRTNYGVILVDIDYFKKYNDTYGHAAGDAVLRQIAQLLQSYQPDLEALTARYGGEEFSMVLVDASCEALEALAKSLCLAVSEQSIAHVGSPFGFLTISVGALSVFAGAPLPDRLAGPNALGAIFNAADQALYEVKNNGRNSYKMGSID